MQANFTLIFQVTFEQRSLNEFVARLIGNRETIFFVHIVENTIVDNQQFFIEIYYPRFINRININRGIILNKSLSPSNGFSPADFVEPRMSNLYGKRDKIFVRSLKIKQT